jgi:hypothetical protein
MTAGIGSLSCEERPEAKDRGKGRAQPPRDLADGATAFIELTVCHSVERMKSNRLGEEAQADSVIMDVPDAVLSSLIRHVKTN